MLFHIEGIRVAAVLAFVSRIIISLFCFLFITNNSRNLSVFSVFAGILTYPRNWHQLKIGDGCGPIYKSRDISGVPSYFVVWAQVR